MGSPQYVTVVKKESLARGSLTVHSVLQWGPQYHIQVRPQKGILGPERSTMPCSDTCHLSNPPNVPKSLYARPWPQTSRGDACVVPIMGAVGGKWLGKVLECGS